MRVDRMCVVFPPPALSGGLVNGTSIRRLVCVCCRVKRPIYLPIARQAARFYLGCRES